MVAFSQTPWSRYRVRCISLPTRPHPTTIRIDQELTKLKSLETSSFQKTESISIRISGLVELYKSINEVLNLPLTQQTLASHRQENWVQELVDGSVKYLDICDNTRNAVSVIKESLRQLQSAIRRSKYEDSGAENGISAYIFSRKRIKHECLKKTLREMDSMIGDFPPLQLENQLTAAVIKVLREASSVTNSVFIAFLNFLAVPVPALARQKPSRWLLVSRIVNKGGITRNDRLEKLNELEDLDIALDGLRFRSLNKDGEAMMEKIQFNVRERLQGLDMSIEGIEIGLESLFREMIQTRVSLLNILSG